VGIGVLLILNKHNVLFFFTALQPLVCHGLIVVEASRSHLDSPYSVELLWTSDQPDAETSDNIQILTTHRHPCPSEGYESAIPASERP